MVSGKTYRVIKRVKIHTKPLVEADVVLTGRFLKETPKQFLFNGFRVFKDKIISIESL